jgi:uncharacterized membrane protein HdeD (DUF308 family)
MKDLRIPLGVFFAILGVVLMASPRVPARLTDAPVNLYAGVSMVLFGGVMLLLAFRKAGR